MKTLREKITFFLTVLAYLLFHLRLGSTAGSVMAGTVRQLLVTAPYCIGFTWLLVRIIRHLHHGRQPAWDRTARIFLSVGIFFGFYFGLYEHAERGQQQFDMPQQEARPDASASAKH